LLIPNRIEEFVDRNQLQFKASFNCQIMREASALHFNITHNETPTQGKGRNIKNRVTNGSGAQEDQRLRR
jgi:hypothetical protein